MSSGLQVWWCSTGGHHVSDCASLLAALLHSHLLHHQGRTHQNLEMTLVNCESYCVFIGKDLADPLVVEGDIAVPYGLQNADPCTARGCLWPKATDGNVYVPYRISNQYCEQTYILFTSTCVRFTPLDRQRDFVDIQSQGGCFSFVGRRGGAQVVSLARQGCVFQSTIQHELLHALGFDHEQSRSDRDTHIRILLENVIRMEFNFRKIQTRNLGTPYDYNSVMHYGRFAFSSNRQPTIVPIPDANVAIGRATQMSPNDILRINRLYNCISILHLLNYRSL
uniref:Metalloendopeptidase n=1 Tax=Periophthalmus magnuspinnatus TaxID=409849 RepID=A0A3B4B0X6_9GOBI